MQASLVQHMPPACRCGQPLAAVWRWPIMKHEVQLQVCSIGSEDDGSKFMLCPSLRDAQV